MKKIQIVGAGSVGMLMATYLVQRDYDVHLICRRPQQVERLLAEGIQREDLDGTLSTFSIHAHTEYIEDADLTIVAVKSNEISSLINLLPIHKPLLFIQNGLAHFQQIAPLNLPNIAFGSAQFGALKHSDTFVSHRGFGTLKLAYYQMEYPFLDNIFSEEGDFIVSYEKDAFHMLMEKAIINSLINPLTALLQIPNGQLIENDYAYNLLQTFYKELVTVFPNECPPFPLIKDICSRTKNNHSSMLQDHMAHKVSEAPAILGALIQQAQLGQSQTPILQTIYQLVLAKEKQGGFQ